MKEQAAKDEPAVDLFDKKKSGEADVEKVQTKQAAESKPEAKKSEVKEEKPAEEPKKEKKAEKETPKVEAKQEEKAKAHVEKKADPKKEEPEQKEEKHAEKKNEAEFAPKYDTTPDDTPKPEGTPLETDAKYEPAFDTRMEDAPLVQPPQFTDPEIETHKLVDDRKRESGPLVVDKEEKETEANMGNSPLTKSAENHNIFKDREALKEYTDVVHVEDEEAKAALAKKKKANQAAVNHYLSLESEKRRDHRARITAKMEQE